MKFLYIHSSLPNFSAMAGLKKQTNKNNFGDSACKAAGITPVVMMLAPQKALASKKKCSTNGEGQNGLLFAHAKRFCEFFLYKFPTEG